MRLIPRWLAASAARRPATRRARLHATPLERRDVPATFTVSLAADGADTVAGTLRWAITQANASPGVPDTITFALAGPSTVSLASPLPTVTDALDIQGPGAAGLTVSGGGKRRVFALGANGSTPIPISVSGLTVANGLVGTSAAGRGGGGMAIGSADVTLAGVAFVNNLNTVADYGDGAAIYIASTFQASLAASDCTFTGNTVVNGGRGAAIAMGGNGVKALTISKSTFANNSAVSDGGAVFGSASTITLSDSTFTGNTGAQGGALNVGSTATTITGCRFDGNTAAVAGAVLNGGRTLTVARSAFVGNAALSTTTSTLGGGAIGVNTLQSTITVVDSLFANNTAAGGAGGAVNISGTATYRNTTFTGNAAPLGGAIAAAKSQTLQNCTVVRNTATAVGGGISVADQIALVSSVVALNDAARGSPDIGNATAVPVEITAANSFVGVADSAGITVTGAGNRTGTRTAPADPAVGPLASNGGPWQTIAPLAGSPLIDAGSNPAGVATDGRGPGFPRQIGAGVDIGAIERPAASASAAAIASAPLVRVGSAAAGQPYSFAVRYTDDAAVSVASAAGDTAAVRVVGPAGPLTVTAAIASSQTDAAAVTVTYTVTPPGGSFDANDTGLYTISLTAGAVQNAAGQSVPAGTLGTFRVAATLTPVVTTTADSGPGSLRAAVLQANASPDDQETITFAVPTPATIRLTTELPITDGVTVQGPGADLLTLQSTFGARLLAINGPGYNATTVSGLTLTGVATNVKYGAGAAVAVTGDRVTLTGVRIHDNSGTSGAGVSVLGGGVATLDDCTLTGNVGGAVFCGSSTVTVARSEISNNTTATSGAGVYVNGGTLAVIDSLLSGNAATGVGGAIGVYGDSSTRVTVIGSTVANNTSGQYGGGIGMVGVFASNPSNSNSLTLANSTVADNTSGYVGAGVYTVGPATITSTAVVRNVSYNGYSDVATSYKYPIRVADSAIDDIAGFLLSPASDGNVVGVDFKLSPLQPNGGRFRSLTPYAGSPLLDTGANPLGLTTDGRGLPRVAGPAIDIGATERDGPTRPTAASTPPSVTAPATDYSFAVTYADETAVAAASVGGNLAAVRVVGPSGVPLTITAANASTTSGATVTVYYTATPPGGAWTADAAGTYTISVVGGQVVNTAGLAAGAADLATFTVSLPGVFLVTTTAGSGPGSLRQAVLDTNASPGADTITFLLGLFATPQTIPLTAGELTVTDSLTIAGPAAGVTLATAVAGRLMTIDGAGVLDVTISNLTFTGGAVSTGVGGAVSIADESVRFTNCTFVGNTGGLGAAIGMAGATRLSLVGSRFAGNTVTFGGGGVISTATGTGAITGATVDLTDTTFTANTGTAVRATGTTVTITRGVFVGNPDGAIVTSGGVVVTATDTTFTANGAAVRASASVALVRCVFTNNFGGAGGAITAGGIGATLTLTDCTLTGNAVTTDSGSVVSHGGALAIDSDVAVTLTRTTFADNTAPYGGAIGIGIASPTLTVVDCTFVNNRSVQNGGAVYSQAPLRMTATNTTFANNVAGVAGGAIYSESLTYTGTITLRNSTVANNTAGQRGGGIDLRSAPSNTARLDLVSSVVGGNAAPAAADIAGAGTVTLTASAVGAVSGPTVQVGPGSLPVGTDVKLSPLLDTRGPRPAVVPVPGSPLVDAGSNPLGLPTDGRGQPRQVGAGVDIGAAERTPGPDVVAVVLPTVTGPGPNATITVTFGDDQTGALLASSLAGNTAALNVVGPAGPATVTAAVFDAATNGSPRTVTYTVVPPSGSWDAASIGTYTVTLAGGQAKNTAGTAISQTPLGTFSARYSQTLTVTTLLDDGSVGSLRWAMGRANAATQTADVITFAPGLTGTLTLGSQIALTDSVTVNGAGAAVTLTGASGVFNVAGSAAVTLADFAVRGATGGAGAALVVGGGTSATLSRMLIADNTATAGGSGGAVVSAGTLTITDSALTNNVGALGGAVAASGFVTVVRSSLVGNRATRGGAVYSTYVPAGTLAALDAVTADQSLFADNAATEAGGAVYCFATGTAVNTTFTGNTAGTSTASGTGGAYYVTNDGPTLQNCTVVDNAALGPAGQGGGVYAGANSYMVVNSSAVAGNTASGGPDLFRAAGGSGRTYLSNSLIGVNSGYTATGETATLKGTLAAPLDAKLGPLQANGGPTLTRAPLAGSPLIDKGANTIGAVYDQRGVGYARTVGGKTDIGAVEVQPPAVPDTLPPTVTLTSAAYVSTRLGTAYPVTVRLADNYGIDPATVQAADFALTGPGGLAAMATSVAVSGTNPLLATVTFTPPGGTWTADDNGVYTVSLTGSVLDVTGLAATNGPLGTATVAVPVGIAGVLTVLSDGTTTPLSAAGQRSSIPAIRVLFDGPAAKADVAAAYKLVGPGGTMALNATTVSVNGRTQATLTPAAPLADGAYTLTAFGAAIATNAPNGVLLDGNGDGAAGGDYTLGFHRYLADYDGDTAVDGNDLAIFAGTFNAVVGDANYRAWLDLDGDGAIDGNDLAIFAQRFNTVL